MKLGVAVPSAAAPAAFVPVAVAPFVRRVRGTGQVSGRLLSTGASCEDLEAAKPEEFLQLVLPPFTTAVAMGSADMDEEEESYDWTVPLFLAAHV